MTITMPSRSSSRLVLQKQRNSGVATAPTRQQALIRKIKHKIGKKGAVVRIRDFKRQARETMYLVERDGSDEDTWETEDMIGSSGIIAEYQQMVQIESGYSITIGNQQGQKRFSRASKTRAVMALKQSEYANEYNSDEDNQLSGITVHKLSKGSNNRRKSAKKSLGARKTKAQILLDDQHEERLGRMEIRSRMDPESIIGEVESSGGKNCCFQCGANAYREALEAHSLDQLKGALEDKTIPTHHHEDKPNGLDFTQYAVLLERGKFAETLEKYYGNSNSTDFPEVPIKYTNYSGGGTGRNSRIGEYGNRSFKRVEEARGNRVGFSAFYRNENLRACLMNPESGFESSDLHLFLPYMTKAAFREKRLVKNYTSHYDNGSHEVYYAAASGSRLLTRYLLENVNNSGRSTFNQLHEEVLKFENGENLTTFRKTQILKMASDSFNATPYHFAAINPSSVYLSELYEALDPAERLNTDSLGRSVAFFAAVSETSACLEFLESKGFNLSLVDKYKMSPLIQAARFGRSHNVEILVKHLRGGPEVTTTSPFVFQSAVRNRRTALHYAAFFGHAKTCSILIKYNAPVDCVENLDKQTPLIFAAKNGHVDCVRVLIEEGNANPEKCDKFSRTALHYACMFGQIEVVKYLLTLGVNANASDSSSNTPAHFAAGFGYLKILHLLVRYGSADPSISNIWRGTPCSIANMKGHVGIIKYLLGMPKSAIDVNFKDQSGSSMLQNTVNEPVETLLEKGIIIEKVTLLLEMKADVNSTNIEGETSLHTLVSDTSFAKQLPKEWQTFYPNKSTYNQPEPLKHDENEGAVYQKTIVELLIKHGADLNMTSSMNETPLAMAMRLNNHYLVATLIKSGARFWIDVDSNGNNFFHYFGAYTAFINGLQPHYDLDILVRERHKEIAQQMWTSVELNSTSHMLDIANTINLGNAEGVVPLYFGVASAIQEQKYAMIREKKLIKDNISEVSNTNSSGLFGCFNFNSNSNTINPAKVFDKAVLPLSVNLQFDFKLWIHFMSDMVTKFKPDMNKAVDLPKDFKKSNPKATKSEYPTSTGYTALHLAAETQCVDLIQFLLKNGCDPNAKVQLDNEVLSGDTPIIIAYRLKKDLHQELPDQSLESTEKLKKSFVVSKPNFKRMLHLTIKTLVQFNASPFFFNLSGNSAVLKASANLDDENLAQMCGTKSSRGGNIDQKNENNESALMIAVKSIGNNIGHPDEERYLNCVKHLLKAGANPNMKYEDGDTILNRIIITGNLLLLQTFIQNSVVTINHDLQNKKLENALIMSCKLRIPDIILTYLQYLKCPSVLCELNVLDNGGNSALSYAAKNGIYKAVNELLLGGADPNFHDYRHVPLIEGTNSQNIDIVESILKHGAHVNATEKTSGNSSLHSAILTKKHRIIKLLLNHGADFDLPNFRKQTPMHLAIETTKRQTNRSFRAERLLMKAGANANAVDFFGRTPLHYVFVDCDLIPITRNTVILSKKVKQIAKELQAKQERLETLNDYAHKFDLGKFSGVSSENVDYLSVWMKSAKETRLNQAKIEENQCKNKVEDIFVLEEEKDTLKLYCNYVWESATINPARSDPIDILKYLSDFKGLKLDVKDEFGRTPLHYAACVGAFSCTSLLIENKVDINALDSDNNGSVQLALRNNYVDYSVMLCNFGATVSNNIVMKDGKSMSTFGFSLSQSLLNMAYLTIDRGVTLIESIRDALKNGKFHMVEILLESASDESLSQTLPDGQKIWHIISDFKPFNNEVWEEYVGDITERLLTLSLPICNDIHQRSPIHYAAKHGQAMLLRQLISMADEYQIQSVDKDGNAPIDYAVNSKNFDCVKYLLSAGASVSSTNGFQKPSLILKSIQADTHNITDILLQHKSPVNEDIPYGRISAIMVACQKRNLKLVNLLIASGVNMNEPCYVERNDNDGKKFTVLLYPIFAASYRKSLLLDVMLQAGANPNVYGPDSKPECGRSCFMYNVDIDSIENQQTLLKYDIDLNSIDSKLSRTIFYQFFFGKMKYKQKFRDDYSIDNQNLNFNDVIYEKMIQSFQPEVNYIDKVTSMTPLELAIHQKNMIIIERLLLLGADVNIESCNNTGDFVSLNIMNPSKNPIPAILHAIIQNNGKVLDLLCKNSQTKVNWSWHDEENRNILSYLVGCNGGFSTENVDMLRYIFAKVDTETFKNLLEMRDIYDKSPICYAYARKNKLLYDTLIGFGLVKFNSYDKEPKPNDSLPMEIDFISTQKVDEDAQIERAILQKEKDIENANKLIAHDNQDLLAEVDKFSKLGKVGYIMLDENNQPYDTMLTKVDIMSYGVYAEVSFYKMSIIHNKVLNVNILWTRWGMYGDEGQHQKTPFLDLEEAIAEFKKIFKAKTANSWENRHTSFVQKQGRYDILKKFNHPKDTLITNFNFLDSTLPVHLPCEITNVMKLICNYTYLSRVYIDSRVDMPLGQIPQKTIEEARKLLKDVEYMSKKFNEVRVHRSDKAKLSESKTWEFRIAQKCVEYALLLPCGSEKRNPIKRLLDDSNRKTELSRVDDLGYVGFAANVILAAKHHLGTTHPFQYVYQTLNCSLRNLSDYSEYQMIKSYMLSTSNGNHELVHLLAVNRVEEESRFNPFKEEGNRKLLWHGSRVGNFMGILKQGLRVSPSTSTSNGAMLGSGVYFADTFAKSLNYATEDYGSYRSAYKLLILCEVALGSKMAVYENYYSSTKADELHSMKGEGSNIPDPDNEIYNANGVCIPMGPCIPFYRSNNNGHQTPLLGHNEYAVYDEDRVKIRYLLIIRESTSCFLCSKPDKNYLKPLYKHNVKKYNFTAFNSFEGEVIKAYLSHENISPQEIFEQELDNFIDSRDYKKKWSVPLDLCKESKVCYTCAQDVTTILLEKKMTDSDINVPESLQTKPYCQYGKECRTQNRISHAKKYQHWLKENTSARKDDADNIKEVNDAVDSEMGTEVEDESLMETEDETEEEDFMDTDDE